MMKLMTAIATAISIFSLMAFLFGHRDLAIYALVAAVLVRQEALIDE